MQYLILAQSEVTARALGAWLELLGEPPLRTEADGRLDDKRVVSSRSPETGPGGFVAGVERLCAEIAERVNARPSGEVAILVDTVRPADLSAVGSPAGWNRLVCLLILAFPEVRWVFGVSQGEKLPDGWEARHGLASLFGPVFDPLFDGTGLRCEVRRQTAKAKAEKGPRLAPWIPLRREWAAVIDDEAMYAYLHAYVAYRNGYRAFPIHRQSLADHLLRKEGDGWSMGAPHLSLEDLYLGFPDKGNEVPSLSSLSKRDGYWKRLKEASFRHFITSGHGRSQDRNNVAENRAFRAELRRQGKGGREAIKPIAGIFALWKQLGLDRGDGRRWRGLAPGFVWPPVDKESWDPVEEPGGHSAPGLLLLVAEQLIARAERLLEETRGVQGAVRGAVLVTSALELLGPKTPATAREALELKHRYEVFAECQFGGIQYNLQPEARFAEIRQEMRLLGRWFGVRARDAAVLSGELTILSRIVRIFRDHEEFDEEEKCRRRIRALHRRIWWKQKRHNPLAWLVWPIRTYIEFLLGSNTRFTGAIIGWIAGLTAVFYCLDEGMVEDETPSTVMEFSQAISFFFGTEPLNSGDPAWAFFTVLAIVSGFVHLGVFISQLYATVARR